MKGSHLQHIFSTRQAGNITPLTFMRWFTLLSTLNLIDVFNYYLTLALVVGTVFRIRNYRAILGVIFTFSHRWPKLLVLAKQHRIVFLRWPTLLPIGLTLVLMLGNVVASHYVWSQAKITFADLWWRWWAILIITTSGGLMVFLDCKAIFGFGRFDAQPWRKNWTKPSTGCNRGRRRSCGFSVWD